MNLDSQSVKYNKLQLEYKEALSTIDGLNVVIEMLCNAISAGEDYYSFICGLRDTEHKEFKLYWERRQIIEEDKKILEKAAALAKLTDREKKLLGIRN